MTKLIKPFWGHYDMQPACMFSFNKIWRYNPSLGINRHEQLQQNKANHPDFIEREHIPAAIKLSFA